VPRRSFGKTKRTVAQNSWIGFPNSPLKKEPRKVSFSKFEPAQLPHEPGSLSQQKLTEEASKNNSRATREANTGVVVGTDYSSGDSLVSVPGSKVVRVQANQATQGSQVTIDTRQQEEYERIRKFGTTVNSKSSFSGWKSDDQRTGVSTGTLTTTKSIADIGLLRDDCTPPDVKARIIESALVNGVYLDAQGNYLGDTVGYGGSLTLAPSPLRPNEEIYIRSQLLSSLAITELYNQSKQEAKQQQSLPSYLSLTDLGGQSTVGFTSDIPTLWKCEFGVCIQAEDGLYPSRELCETNCGQTSWSCVNGTCVEIPGLTAPFRTQDECISQGCNTRFSCVSGEPVPDPNGPYATRDAAIADGCYWGYGKDTSGACIPQISGPFKSLACCQQNQINPVNVYFANQKGTGIGEILGAPVAEPYIFQEVVNTVGLFNIATTVDYSFSQIPGIKEIKYRGNKIPDSYWILQTTNEIRVSLSYSFTASLTATEGTFNTGDPISIIFLPQFQESQLAVVPNLGASIVGPSLMEFPEKEIPFRAIFSGDLQAEREQCLVALLRDAEFENLISSIKPWCRLSPGSPAAGWANNSGLAPYTQDEGSVLYFDRILVPENQQAIVGTVTGVDGENLVAQFTGSVVIRLPNPAVKWLNVNTETFTEPQTLSSYRIFGLPGSFILGPFGVEDTYLANSSPNLKYGAMDVGNYRCLGHYTQVSVPLGNLDQYTFNSLEGTFDYSFQEFSWPLPTSYTNNIGTIIPWERRALKYPLLHPDNQDSVLLNPDNIWYFWGSQTPPQPWGQWRGYWSDAAGWDI
jgi:hypothetical protein